MMNFQQIKAALKKAVENLERNRNYLDDLDEPIGDSDHGEGVSNSFRRAFGEIESMEARDIGALFQTFGRGLIFFGGGAAGPLYGTAFLEGGKAVSGKEDLSLKDLEAFFSAFEEGIARIGGAKLGEKTMLDTVHPAVHAFRSVFSEGADLKSAVLVTVEAAHAGMESTKDMISTRGRSSRLGERSIGHIDPGAASCYLFIKSFLEELIS